MAFCHWKKDAKKQEKMMRARFSLSFVISHKPERINKPY